MSTPSLKTPWLVQLLLATVLSQATVFSARPMTSYRALELGAGGFEVGLLTACFAILPLVVAVPIGRGVDGRRAEHFLRAGAACTLVGTAGLALAGSLWALAVANVVAGMGLLLSAVAGQGMLAQRAPESGHDRVFGWFTVAASLGQLVGPPLAGYVAQHAPGGAGGGAGLEARAGLVCAVLVGVLGLASVVRLAGHDPDASEVARDRPGDHVPMRLGSLIRTRGMPQAILASLALLACLDLLTAFLPLLGQERGISAVAVGWLLALRALASLASRLIVARLSAAVGRQRLLVVSMIASALLLTLLPWTSDLVLLGALMLVTGFLLGIGQPLTMSWVAGLVPPRNRATALAIRLSGNRLGQVAVPVSAGLVAASGGISAVFWLVAALLGAAGVSVAAQRPER